MPEAPSLKHLSFGILFYCVFLPPVLYIFTLQGLEAFFEHQWRSELRSRLITDTDALLSGQIRIQNHIRNNIQQFLKSRSARQLGVRADIAVQTREGLNLYPHAAFESEGFASGSPEEYSGFSQSMKIAERNLDILEQGLSIALSVRIPRNTWLANSILIFYILVFSTLLYLTYRSRARQAERVTQQQQADLESARERLEQVQSRLEETSRSARSYETEINRLRNELQQADSRIQATEEEALSELAELEKKLEEAESARQARESEMQALKQEVDHLESVQKPASKKRDKELKFLGKRFRILYKGLEFHERALEGFLQLSEEMQLKAEECIHTLNRDTELIKVKRKVFSKKGTLPAFETEFGYRGRLYWRRTSEGKVQVLTIGTKNTQNRDLSYLERVTES